MRTLSIILLIVIGLLLTACYILFERNQKLEFSNKNYELLLQQNKKAFQEKQDIIDSIKKELLITDEIIDSLKAIPVNTDNEIIEKNKVVYIDTSAGWSIIKRPIDMVAKDSTIIY